MNECSRGPAQTRPAHHPLEPLPPIHPPTHAPAAHSNLAVGGPTTAFTDREPLGDTLASGPKAMRVDYVRVHGLRYALSQAAAGGGGGGGGGGQQEQQSAEAQAAR